MPKFGRFVPAIEAMGASVYSSFASRLAKYKGEKYPLHIGDTYLAPAEGCRVEDFKEAQHVGLHRYSGVLGRLDLRLAIAERVSSRSGRSFDPSNVLVTAGATGGLGAIVGAIVSPLDEVLVLAPHWPLIAGIVRCFGGKPISVPVIGEGLSTADTIELLRSHLTNRTVAVYINTPSNPTGLLLSSELMAAIGEFARAQDLWVLSDEVYEDFVFTGKHTPFAGFAPERTISAHSFSKAYGMAGNRVGYLVGPSEPILQASKVATNTYYSAPTVGQYAALAALKNADAWVARAQKEYGETGAKAAEILGLPAPAGSTFLFLDVSDCLDASGLTGFLSRCVDRGLLVAPGPAFGPYPTHIRVCFTSAPPDTTLRGFEVLRDVMTG